MIIFFAHRCPSWPHTKVGVCHLRCIQTCPRLHEFTRRTDSEGRIKFQLFSYIQAETACCYMRQNKQKMMNMDWETNVSSEIVDTEDWLKTVLLYDLLLMGLSVWARLIFPKLLWLLLLSKHGKGKVKRRPQKKVDALSKEESVSRQHKRPPQLEEPNVSIYHQ